MEIVSGITESTITSAGFFWKALWAFILGYAVSAVIQVFVPKRRLTSTLGNGDPASIALASLFGAISSSCSFAALSTSRSLVFKGAHWREALAFMFASTNLVMELGILIVVFLGWQYLVAEVIGGVILIAISTSILTLVVPKEWLEAARETVQEEGADFEVDFDWKNRITSLDGWRKMAATYLGEWGMVWKEIFIGFSAAGIIATWVPAEFWKTIFLTSADLPQWLVILENALVGPLVAMSTFIGSMGNIPLATVLASGGVAFSGIMAFIYSDLVVPPLVAVNARYYGWKAAIGFAGVMYVSMVCTALLLASGVALLDIAPEPQRVMSEVTRFKLDYTFWLNLGFGVLTLILIALGLQQRDVEVSVDFSWKNVAVALFAAVHAIGLAGLVVS